MADFDPAARSSDYVEQEGFWSHVSDVLAGEDAIKGKKETYLPRLPAEEDANYLYRLSIATFTNIYGDISKNLASKPFAKELTLSEKSDKQFLDLAENIDGNGNNLHVFSEAVFKSGQDYSLSYILVDYTRASPRADGRPLSKTEESQQGLRPYWVFLPAAKVLAVYSSFLNGVETIFHARVDESAVEFDGEVETRVERVRVMRRDPIINQATGNVMAYGSAYWQLYEKQATGAGRTRKNSWQVVDAGEYSIGVIPLVPFFAGKRVGSKYMAAPVLRDLLNMQLAEYRQESDIEWTRVMTCFPMLCISGAEIKDKQGNVVVTVGPSQVLGIPQNKEGSGPAGDAKYIEPTTASIQEQRNQLELRRKEMRDLGMQPVTSANLTVVTTKNVSMKASSAMQMLAIQFKDMLEQCWKITGLWLKSDKEPEVIIHTDFAIELEEGKELDAILSSVEKKIISKKTARDELKRRSVVSNDLTDEEEEQRIAEESEGLEGEEEIEPRTGNRLRVVEDAA